MKYLLAFRHSAWRSFNIRKYSHFNKNVLLVLYSDTRRIDISKFLNCYFKPYGMHSIDLTLSYNIAAYFPPKYYQNTIIVLHFCPFQMQIFREVGAFQGWLFVTVSHGVCIHCVHVCVCIFFHRKGFCLNQNNKCNARDQTSDVALRKLLCVK